MRWWIIRTPNSRELLRRNYDLVVEEREKKIFLAAFSRNQCAQKFLQNYSKHKYYQIPSYLVDRLGIGVDVSTCNNVWVVLHVLFESANLSLGRFHGMESEVICLFIVRLGTKGDSDRGRDFLVVAFVL